MQDPMCRKMTKLLLFVVPLSFWVPSLSSACTANFCTSAILFLCIVNKAKCYNKSSRSITIYNNGPLRGKTNAGEMGFQPWTQGFGTCGNRLKNLADKHILLSVDSSSF